MSMIGAGEPNDDLSGACRRAATRYEPTRRDACLSWRDALLEDPRSSGEVEGGGGHRPQQHHFALLLDISHTGASVITDDIHLDVTGVRLRLEGESSTKWTDAKIVGVTTTTRGPHLVRLTFPIPCEFETLEAAIFG